MQKLKPILILVILIAMACLQACSSEENDTSPTNVNEQINHRTENQDNNVESLVDGNEHTWSVYQKDSHIKGAYVGLKFQYSNEQTRYENLISTLKDKGYNKVYLYRGGLRIHPSTRELYCRMEEDKKNNYFPNCNSNSLLTLSPQTLDQLNEDFALGFELVFAVNNETFQSINDRENPPLGFADVPPTDFDEKITYYAENFACPLGDWIYAHRNISPDDKKVHLNLEMDPGDDDEAATIALIGLFRKPQDLRNKIEGACENAELFKGSEYLFDEWEVSVSILHDWDQNHLEMMKNKMGKDQKAYHFVYQTYNLGVDSPEDGMCQAE